MVSSAHKIKNTVQLVICTGEMLLMDCGHSEDFLLV